MSVDWIQPPLHPCPGDLRPALAGSRLVEIVNDRSTRRVRLRFALSSDAGTPEATFAIEGATHLLGFVYLPPIESMTEGLSPEEAIAAVGDWARQGLIVSADPLSYDTTLVVERAFLHPGDGSATLTIEGYGENADRLVWWEVRVSGTSVEAV